MRESPAHAGPLPGRRAVAEGLQCSTRKEPVSPPGLLRSLRVLFGGWRAVRGRGEADGVNTRCPQPHDSHPAPVALWVSDPSEPAVGSTAVSLKLVGATRTVRVPCLGP